MHSSIFGHGPAHRPKAFRHPLCTGLQQQPALDREEMKAVLMRNPSPQSARKPDRDMIASSPADRYQVP